MQRGGGIRIELSNNPVTSRYNVFETLFFGNKKSPGYLPRLICRGGGIRTPGTSRYNGFQDRRIRPLCHSSFIFRSLSKGRFLQLHFLSKRAEPFAQRECKSIPIMKNVKSWEKIFLGNQIFFCLVSCVKGFYVSFGVCIVTVQQDPFNPSYTDYG